MPDQLPASVEGIEERARALSTVVMNIGGIYGDTITHPTEDIIGAFAECLTSINEYCESHDIVITELDTIKLFSFAIPLLRQKQPSANMGRYLTACILFITGKSYGDLPPTLAGSARVLEKMSRREPPEHIQIYLYLKGLQEAFDLTDQAGLLV